MTYWHTIPNQHFAHIGTSPTPSYLSTLPAAHYQPSHTRSRTIYYYISIVFMSNSYVVQVLCFAWAVTLAEACRVGDSNIQIPHAKLGPCLATHVYSCVSLRRLKMVTLCYADKFVTERTDDVSKVLIEDSISLQGETVWCFGPGLLAHWCARSDILWHLPQGTYLIYFCQYSDIFLSEASSCFCSSGQRRT